ncbi:Os03g0638250 [Oryza sativa Japonica Group]|uniref:Os03g0638250 protein n=1 Tax=Oryza sativa subsp. japonica TaxID=39947 RepID=A0A0P0W0J2_ORYSJ|nr:hypothetical protein EE612_019123 [Oryza sativa]BAS85408.1 Os03g0638250 [Oryza sativa Japonica Group]
MASIWWQLLNMPTATRGQTTPPILPIAVAMPTPVERADLIQTSGAYKHKTVKLPMATARAPNRRTVVNSSFC